MDKYSEIKSIIDEAIDIVEFAEYGNGISDEWIKKAEKRLGFNLPETYKWWLRNYGGGEIRGEEIYSIYEQDFDTVVGGDIVYMYDLNKNQYNYGSNMLFVCEKDDSAFYFDVSANVRENEYPIISLNENKLYAQDFIEFLKKKIIND